MPHDEEDAEEEGAATSSAEIECHSRFAWPRLVARGRHAVRPLLQARDEHCLHSAHREAALPQQRLQRVHIQISDVALVVCPRHFFFCNISD